ncbi:MAG: Gfo/Idh/MocA family oxidoreductase [Oscillospiraceae bacterium]|nr:Gfo/Idh/MocA family oxidoreductase [Oscillospiraceae bacterium]
MSKKRYCIAGASSRGYYMYAANIAGEQFKENAELCGIYDINIGRSRYVSDKTGVKIYEDFDEMLKTEKPEAVIVTTMDAFHSEYAVRSLTAGYDVITEKPMCITSGQAYAMLEAEKNSGKRIIVTHNMRYMPYILNIKKLITEGKIGDIYNVNFEWNLVYNGHGTSYYRRWHGIMANSGGLLLTKSSHHFDCANWFIDSLPSKVFGFGKVSKYGKNGKFRGKSCRSCEHKTECEFYSDMTNYEFITEFYFDNEKYDGYIYDGCVFNEKIDAYDTVNLAVQYENNVSLSYTLNAAASYEGWRMTLNGSAGRLEIGHTATGDSRDSSEVIKYYSLDGKLEVIETPPTPGVHGGGDIRLLNDIMFGRTDGDPFKQQADSVDGAAAVMIGAAANESIKTGKVVDVTELLGAELKSYKSYRK